jgi:hypothetical protein
LLVYAFPRRRRRSIARCESICAAAVDRLPGVPQAEVEP